MPLQDALPKIKTDIQKMALTFAIAAITGWLFLQFNVPAPFLMGSLFGVWFIGGAIKPLQPHLGVARWFHIPVVLGLGVFIGSFFQGDLIARTIASLRYLGGDNAGGSPGCPSSDDRSSNARKYYHHLTFYGFMMCFASTSLGTIYHYFLGREAPYGYFELPVLLGTIGGIILCIGTAGLWIEKRRMDPAVRSWRSLGMDYAFIGLLFWVSLTGLILLALRETSWMGLTLAIHLGFVYGFFLVLPFSKFVHGLYRFAALIQSASESKSH